MFRKVFLKLTVMVLSSMLLFSCAQKKMGEDQYSGYLEDYSQLQNTRDTKGDAVLRYVVPD